MMKSDEPEVPVASIAPFGLRLQPGLKRRLEEAARAAGRSLNTEIALRLEASMTAEPHRPSNVRFRTAAEAKAERELLQAAHDYGARFEALEADVAALKVKAGM